MNSHKGKYFALKGTDILLGNHSDSETLSVPVKHGTGPLTVLAGLHDSAACLCAVAVGSSVLSACHIAQAQSCFYKHTRAKDSFRH